MRVIGAIGQNGSGKDEVLKYLRSRYGVPFLSTGDIVRGIAAREGVEPTRDNLQRISERYFRQFSQGYFVKLLAEQVQQDRRPVTGISGIRSLEDVTILKNIFGKDFILINVYVSDPRERYSRVYQRREARDPQDYAQFQQQDEAEEKIFHTQEAVKYADYSISNDGTLTDLHREIDRLVVTGKVLTA
ncbi:MAG: AAA family ATPase [Dehalococcoidales bacterium]|nr:AAA family ATPase [Dehalococcoidales bacterium]